MIHRDAVFFGTRIAVEFGGQIAGGAGALGHGGHDFLEIPPPLLRRQFREIMILGVVFVAEIIPGDADLRLAARRQHHGIDGVGMILTVFCGFDFRDRAAGQHHPQAPRVGGGSGL